MPDEKKSSTIGSFAGRFGRRKPQGPVTAIEIDGSILRVVQTSGSGSSVTVTRTAVEQLELAEAQASDPMAIGQALTAALQRLRIKPAAGGMGVPRPMV